MYVSCLHLMSTSHVPPSVRPWSKFVPPYLLRSLFYGTLPPLWPVPCCSPHNHLFTIPDRLSIPPQGTLLPTCSCLRSLYPKFLHNTQHTTPFSFSFCYSFIPFPLLSPAFLLPIRFLRAVALLAFITVYKHYSVVQIELLLFIFKYQSRVQYTVTVHAKIHC